MAAIPTPVSAVSPSHGAWGSVVVVGACAIALVGVSVVLARILTRVLGGIRAGERRLRTYECGEAPVGPAWFRFNNRFTIVALTFLVFDVELALLWPVLPRCIGWLAEGRGKAMFVEIAVYVATLAIGLFWVAAGGGFVWDRTLSPDLDAPDLAVPRVEDRNG